jgi:hypothetical protein
VNAQTNKLRRKPRLLLRTPSQGVFRSTIVLNQIESAPHFVSCSSSSPSEFLNTTVSFQVEGAYPLIIIE